MITLLKKLKKIKKCKQNYWYKNTLKIINYILDNYIKYKGDNPNNIQ